MTNTPKVTTLPATYFDGHSMAGQVVQVRHQAGYLLFTVNEVPFSVETRAMVREESWGNTPLVYSLPGEGFPAAHLEFESAPCRPTLKAWGLLSLAWHERILSQPTHWLTVSAGAFALAFVLYVYWVPALINQVAMALPQHTLSSLFEDVLPQLDAHLFEPSALNENTRAKHQAMLVSLIQNKPELQHVRLVHRASKFGPNAFALPNGTVVLTDELVHLLNSEQILGVIAHELGHVAERHTAKAIMQSTLITVLLATFTGDTSLVLTGALSQLGTLHFSRDLELAADQFAIDLFIEQGRALKPLKDLHQALGLIVGDHEEHPNQTNYFSTHPSTSERLELIRKHMAAQGGRTTPSDVE